MPVGRRALRALGTVMLECGPSQPALDLWCRSTGIITAGSWACLDDSAFSSLKPELMRSIHQFLALMSGLAQATPSLLAWVLAATRVVRPLVPIAGYARSSHDPEVPGLIEVDLSRGPTQTIELIVHETAHLHLRAAQAAEPLVDPQHEGTYHSPLRPEPRPLMGILLAYHALSYICAALLQATAAAILAPESTARALDDLGRRRDDARTTMDGARCHLTAAGAKLLDRTHKVADYAVA
jgi:HEXXH motif-containing protein